MATEYASAEARGDSTRASQLVASAAFQELQRSRARVATILTNLTVAAYFSFVLFVLFAPFSRMKFVVSLLYSRKSTVDFGCPPGQSHED